MKDTILIAFLALLLTNSSFAQDSTRPVHSTHFKVCDVRKATKPLETVPYSRVAQDSGSIALLNQNAWQAYVQDMKGLTESQKYGLYDWVYRKDLPQTIKIDAASQSMKHYFDYKFSVSCGIPEITLEGTPEDWALLEKHAADLSQFDLAWWINPLKPILAEFTKASKGEVNADFWDNMVKYRSYSIICASQPFLSGWMLHFFPYYQGKPNPWVANPEQVKKFETAFTSNEKEKKSIDRKIVEPEQFGLPTLTVSDLPSSMSAAPIEFNYHGTPYNYELLAGVIGVRQDDRTFALRPEFGWRVLDKGLKEVKTDAIFAEYMKKYSKK